MSTSKVLQVPKIIKIIGSTIRIAHPDISENYRTNLASTIAAAGTAMTVTDNNTFADNDWLLVGEVGDAKTEEVDINQADVAGTGMIAQGTSVTVTASVLAFAHEVDAPVTKIYERGIAIYGTNSATEAAVGTGTLIASVNAITTPIADAVMIQWNKPYTEYTLQATTDTAYTYYFVKFTDGTTSSTYSEYVAATGLATNTVEYFIRQACKNTNTTLSDQGITREHCVEWANDCQDAITQFMYQDPRTGDYRQKDWNFEEYEDETSLTVTENENKYALLSFDPDPKYLNSSKGIISVRIGSKLIDKIDSIRDFDEEMEDRIRTNVKTQATAGATSIVLDNTYEFDESGTIYVGGDAVTYTANAETTGTLSGIPASGTGSITETHAVDAAVWQNVSPSLPTKYCIYDGYIVFNYPPDEDYASFPIRVRYYKKLTALTDVSDITEVPFVNVFQIYIAAKIEQRKGNVQNYKLLMAEFEKIVLNNAIGDKLTKSDVFVYREVEDP